jgi:hypothetical protein
MTETTNFTGMAMLVLQQFHETKKNDIYVKLLHTSRIWLWKVCGPVLYFVPCVWTERGQGTNAGTRCLQDSHLYIVDLDKSWNE